MSDAPRCERVPFRLALRKGHAATARLASPDPGPQEPELGEMTIVLADLAG
jgi:hypothetical protein